MIEYEDFSLKIGTKRGEVYPISVLDSPAGQGRGTFRLPFDLEKIDSTLLALGRVVRGSAPTPSRDLSPAAATRTLPEEIGRQLFQELFAGRLGDLFHESIGRCSERQCGLRITLHTDPEDPTQAELRSLPWEFLYYEEKRRFLSLYPDTPIVRYLDVQQSYTPLPLDPPLRILVVISRPRGHAGLDLDKECKRIEREWGRHEGVQVEFMERASIEALHERLAEEQYRYHVLHYMGHGDFDEETGRGVLVMEREDDQRAAKVDGETLGVLLEPARRTMSLVFLNACETAKITRKKGLDPFAGVAAALVLAGMPAVVAMQFPISDDAAIQFAGTFYACLARRDPVDAAVTEGRRRILFAAGGDTKEWGTPVLFMRVPKGIIFQLGEVKPEEKPSRPIGRRKEPKPPRSVKPKGLPK